MKFIVVLCVLFSACSKKTSDSSRVSYEEQAAMLAKKFILVDGHIDVPHQLKKEWRDISILDSTMNFDFPKSRHGGIDAPFMSIYVSATYQNPDEGSGEKNEGGAFKEAEFLIGLMEKVQDAFPDKFKIATTPQEIQSNFKKGLVSLPLGMENGAPLENKLENVEYFFNRGIRYITLTHSQWNHICDSSYDEEKKWNGLSPFGYQVVEEMNRLGMLVDISHVSDSTFYDVIKHTKSPVIASHSSCRHFTPGFERNMSDEMIKALAENGGIIMINFGSSFITKDANEFRGKFNSTLEERAKVQGISKSDTEKWQALRQGLMSELQFPFATLNDVVDHIDHVKKLVGVEHIGLGSDYDGVGNTLPTGLKDASTYPALIAELLKRGYTETEIEKICSGNLFRVWNKVIDVSKSL